MGSQGQWRSFRVVHREGSPGVWVEFSFVTLGKVLNFLGLGFLLKQGYELKDDYWASPRRPLLGSGAALPASLPSRRTSVPSPARPPAQATRPGSCGARPPHPHPPEKTEGPAR